MGRTAEALKDSEKAVEFSNGGVFIHLGHAQALAAEKMTEAETLVAKLWANPAVKYVSPYQIALVYCYAKHTKKRFPCLKKRGATASRGWCG